MSLVKRTGILLIGPVVPIFEYSYSFTSKYGENRLLHSAVAYDKNACCNRISTIHLLKKTYHFGILIFHPMKIQCYSTGMVRLQELSPMHTKDFF